MTSLRRHAWLGDATHRKEAAERLLERVYGLLLGSCGRDVRKEVPCSHHSKGSGMLAGTVEESLRHSLLAWVLVYVQATLAVRRVIVM